MGRLKRQSGIVLAVHLLIAAAAVYGVFVWDPFPGKNLWPILEDAHLNCSNDADCEPYPNGCYSQQCINREYIPLYKEKRSELWSEGLEGNNPDYFCTCFGCGPLCFRRPGNGCYPKSEGCFCRNGRCYNPNQHLSLYVLFPRLAVAALVIWLGIVGFSLRLRLKRV